MRIKCSRASIRKDELDSRVLMSKHLKMSHHIPAVRVAVRAELG